MAKAYSISKSELTWDDPREPGRGRAAPAKSVLI
jgi:hypothetical protein